MGVPATNYEYPVIPLSGIEKLKTIKHITRHSFGLKLHCVSFAPFILSIMTIPSQLIRIHSCKFRILNSSLQRLRDKVL